MLCYNVCCTPAPRGGVRPLGGGVFEVDTPTGPSGENTEMNQRLSNAFFPSAR